MTLIEATTLATSLKKNSGYSKEQLVLWLSQLDGMVKNEILNKFEDGDNIEFNGYDETTPDDTVLLIPHPYDMVYQHWLAMQIDYTNQESTYLAAQTMFNSAYVAFEKWYYSAHKPKPRQFRFF